MITASFSKRNGKFNKFCISGHSGYAPEGSDIVCASVSSMTVMTINNITESFGLPAEVKVEEESVTIACTLLTEDEVGIKLVQGLYNELCILQGDYPKYIKVITE